MNIANKHLRETATDSTYNLASKISHAEFVEGIKNKTLVYSILGEPAHLLTGRYERMFKAFVLFYLVSPVFIVPVFSIAYSNIWLLFGISLTYVGAILSKWNNYFPVYLSVYFVAEAVTGHFHIKDIPDFFFLCVIWGCLWVQIAEWAQHTYAKIELMEKPELFALAVKKNKIIVTETGSGSHIKK
jgi:hypothetical protein